MDPNQLLTELLKGNAKPSPFVAKLHFDILTLAAEHCRRLITDTASPDALMEVVALLEMIEHALAYYTLELILTDEPDFGTRLLQRRALRREGPQSAGGVAHG
ncbi:hypothetical protein [Arenimonas alkanexedens]